MWHDVKMLNTAAGTLVVLCALALLTVGGQWVAQRPMFALKAIVVQGIDNAELRHINALTVKSTALQRIKGNFFSVDLDAVRMAFETVPWVRKAEVRREWPNRLVVSVEEHQPLGTWGEDGHLLSMKGEVFTANLAEAEVDGKLLEFDGPVGSERDVLTRYVELHEWLKPISLTPVAVQLSNRFSWSAKLDNGIMVRFGREYEAAKMKDLVARLTQIYPQLATRFGKQIEGIDLRYPNGLALNAGGVLPGVDVKQNKQAK